MQLLCIVTEDIAEDCMVYNNDTLFVKSTCTLPYPRLGMHKYVVTSLGLNFACRHSEHTIVMYVYRELRRLSTRMSYP